MTTPKAVTTTENIAQEALAPFKPFVSIVAPAYNEAAIIEKNLAKLCEYMESLDSQYRWELIVVNDGSRDETGDLAETFAKNRDNVRVLHHMYNFRMGQALRYAFNNCRGDYVVTMDLDLSYSPEHIGRLLDEIRKTRAKIVIASPYMKGGKVSNVPWLRRTFSRFANRFLSFAITKDDLTGRISTITGMVRAYDRRFLSRMNLKAMDIDIQPEILYKAMVLHARIVEIPAHLDWGTDGTGGKQRKSSIRMLKSIISSLMSGFMFRPFMFFILPGLAIMLPTLYTLGLVITYSLLNFQRLPTSFGPLNYRIGAAVADAFKMSPHAFIVGGIGMMVTIQLISLGILALQSKKYFEEIFHVATTVYKHHKDHEDLYKKGS